MKNAGRRHICMGIKINKVIGDYVLTNYFLSKLDNDGHTMHMTIWIISMKIAILQMEQSNYKAVLVTAFHNILVVHYCVVIMGTIASQITKVTIVYSTLYSDADQRKHQSSASLAFVRRIHRRPVKSPHKWPVMRKMFPFDDVIMFNAVQSDTRVVYDRTSWCSDTHGIEIQGWLSPRYCHIALYFVQPAPGSMGATLLSRFTATYILM